MSMQCFLVSRPWTVKLDELPTREGARRETDGWIRWASSGIASVLAQMFHLKALVLTIFRATHAGGAFTRGGEGSSPSQDNSASRHGRRGTGHREERDRGRREFIGAAGTGVVGKGRAFGEGMR